MATRPAEEGMTEGSSTVTVEEAPAQAPVLHLHGAEGSSRGVRWGAEVVDNEGMGKRKSKCCCIYKKPKKWDESDEDESDCETGDCRGHVERKPHAHPHTPPKPDQSAPS